MSIAALLNQISEGEIVLPAIQRDFVWEESKIERLMESIMRGYPIGIILMWETYNNIQYRKFDNVYLDGTRAKFIDNSAKRKLKLVLDGQQRLQSLHIALNGKHNNKYLYFDVLSGRHADDFEEEKYHFYFLTEEEANDWNEEAKNIADEIDEEINDDDEVEYYLKVSDLFGMKVEEKQSIRKKIEQMLKIGEDSQVRLETNIAKLDEVLTKETNILKASIVDENKPSNHGDRKNESDVLEIFVRINRQGTPLSRSDLIFSMLKLNWKDSATALPEFIENINKGNSFNLDIDFVIRCLFAVSELGTKFNVDLLRKRSNIKTIKENFSQCCNAIQSTVDHVQKYCWISSSKALGGDQNLVPFVYYLFHTPKHQVPNKEIDNFRKSLFLFGFVNPFSRYAESRLNKFIKEEIKTRVDSKDYSFPYPRAIWWVNYWERIKSFGPELVQNNPRLVHYIVQQDAGLKAHFVLNEREMDHIFPRSILRDKDYDAAKINHFANFWILGKGKNQNKSNRHPGKYFGDVASSEMKKAFIDKALLDYRRYNTFINNREASLLRVIKKRIGFKESDFDFLESDL